MTPGNIKQGSPVSDRYPVYDLTIEPAVLESSPRVDPAALAQELREISEKIGPVVAAASDHESHFGLDSVEIALTIGVEGGIGFVAKGSAEASITVRFARTGATVTRSDA